jgi:soluble cytochrome b562
VAQAQALMQLMAESGDPRQPAAGGLQPRTPATAAQLANPQAYAAFADEQSRAEVQAWTSGVQQIAQMRENIEQAAQSGERSSSEIDEARAALAQLEMLQNTLQRETPQSLPAVPASKP